MYDPERFAEKYRLAVAAAAQEKPENGLCGFELEWNLLDSEFRPLLTVGSGPGRQSFVDYLRAECLPPWLREYSQLEVFHWMIEWATRPYFHPRGAVYEGRLLEAALLNALHKAGESFGERLYAWHGNLLFQTRIGYDSVPGKWHLAKRRYLERCIDLYGDALATAGTHTNLSLPEPLFAWDFMHLPQTERSGGPGGALHLDAYKSEFYITATRLMRAFAALFVATSASTPLQSQVREGRPAVVLTGYDSVRNLTFPNPTGLDLPDLYRSYDDYLRISYDLVRSGARFGNNNWTPTRARSFAEPVERLIEVTSEQLHDLYARGLYALGEEPANGLAPVEEKARQIEMQNLMARINLPMARVEVRTDDGGQPLEVESANLTLKHLLMMIIYADSSFARAFRYDREDLDRARRNELAAAGSGLGAVIEHPLTAKPVSMRGFLSETLEAVRPLAEALDLLGDLRPLEEMAAGAPNTAERLRLRLKQRLGDSDEVPVEALRELAEERAERTAREVEWIAETYPSLGEDAAKLGDLLQRAREEVHLEPGAPVRFRPRPEALVEITYPDKITEVVALARQLIRIPSVTASPQERLDEVRRAGVFIYDYLRNYGLQARYFNESKYPAILAGFPGGLEAPVVLSGHFDVVEPEPDDGQFEPRVEGDWLWGRGAADMKTVVATYLVWLKDAYRKGPPYPAVNLLLVGNEENGETEAMGTPHVLGSLEAESGYRPGLLIAGERTGERGEDLWGEICTQNRGVMRFEVAAYGRRGHTGVAGAQRDLADVLLSARAGIAGILHKRLTLSSPDGWHSQARFPFIQVGTPGVYNITADRGVLGVEVRPVPQDDVEGLYEELLAYCASQGLELSAPVREAGIACNPDNPYLQALVEAVGEVSGSRPALGRKLPGTSARFAPGGQGVVWGQSGLGPHAANERHFIPSIEPYYRALEAFGARLREA